jgi:hypothetical protein
LPRGDAGLRSITSDHRPRAGWDLPARGARAGILSLHRIGGSSGSRGHRGGCAATARSTARAEDERYDRGTDGEESRVWRDVSRSGRSWTSQHLRNRTRHRASTFPTSGSAAGLSGCSRAARELVAPRLAWAHDMNSDGGAACKLSANTPWFPGRETRQREMRFRRTARSRRDRPVLPAWLRESPPTDGA